MQTLSPALSNHIQQTVTTLATCWKIERKDGVTFYYTNHDQNLVIDTHSYKAASLMSPSAVTSQINLATDNLELEGMLSDDGLKEEDILSGTFDHATITIFMVNYADLAAGKLHLKQGLLGEVQIKNGAFVIEVRGISSVLQQTIGEVYTPTCRAKLGDTRCKVNLASFTFTGSVTAVEGAHAFTDSTRTQASGYFNYGIMTFTSGANNGLSMEVRDYSNKRFGLFLPMPSSISIGDTYSVIAGCDRRIDTCIARFNNAVNFRGEPHVPGTDKIMQTAATRTKA